MADPFHPSAGRHLSAATNKGQIRKDRIGLLAAQITRRVVHGAIVEAGSYITAMYRRAMGGLMISNRYVCRERARGSTAHCWGGTRPERLSAAETNRSLRRVQS